MMFYCFEVSCGFGKIKLRVKGLDKPSKVQIFLKEYQIAAALTVKPNNKLVIPAD